MRKFDWITKTPIAHRGLHDRKNNIIENSQSSFARALEHGFAIEADIQSIENNIPVVFHDATLDRLATGRGPLKAHNLKSLKKITFTGSSDHIQTLDQLLEQVAGKVPIFLDVKSGWGKLGPLERNIADKLKTYKGPIAVMAFNPRAVMVWRHYAPDLPRGLIARPFLDIDKWGWMSPYQRFALRNLLSIPQTQPNFIAYDVRALPAIAPFLTKHLLGLPLLTWTIKTQTDIRRARLADQIIFEGFVPKI